MKSNPARTRLPAAIAGCICLAGAYPPAAAVEFLAATRPVIAIVDAELFVGEAVGHLDGAGTITMHAQLNPALTCFGEFTSSAAAGGQGNLRCSDGTTASFQFKRLNVYRGYGSGNTSRGAMTFAYGLSPHEAAPYLKLPEGKKLSPTGTLLTLIDQ